MFISCGEFSLGDQKGSSGNLFNHLRSKHAKFSSEYGEPLPQVLKVISSASVERKWTQPALPDKLTSLRKEQPASSQQLLDGVALFFVLDQLPFNTVTRDVRTYILIFYTSNSSHAILISYYVF